MENQSDRNDIYENQTSRLEEEDVIYSKSNHRSSTIKHQQHVVFDWFQVYHPTPQVTWRRTSAKDWRNHRVVSANEPNDIPYVHIQIQK